MAYNNFNYGLAFRSQGVTPDMYSDDAEEAQKMMYEDMHARWTPDKGKSFRQGMVQQAAKERNQGGGQRQAQPRATGQAVARANAMGDAPLPQQAQAAAHFGAQNDMIAATNAAIGNEMANRRKLAENERERQHQYQLEAMRQQGASQRAQAQDRDDDPQSGGFQQKNAARQARNRSLLGMAGLGGYRIQNGIHTPHPFQGPLARSLLG
jgi:hypothetical protein